MTFCVSLPIIWRICAKFPQLAPTSQIHQSKYKLTLRGLLDFCRASFDEKRGVKHYEWLSVYQCPWFGVFGSSFSNLPQFPKYTKTSITWPSDGFYPWVRVNLMWSVEFNTLDDSEYLCQISLTCPNFANTQEQVYVDPQMDFRWARLHLMWNVEFNTMNDFLCIGAHDLGYLGPISPTCPSSPNILNHV